MPCALLSLGRPLARLVSLSGIDSICRKRPPDYGPETWLRREVVATAEKTTLTTVCIKSLTETYRPPHLQSLGECNKGSG
jgi:hypothetical protein